ncbi:MAG: DNA repair protein RecN [Bacteroidia bacterium]|nr:DNA repair protein RecN [Bacteroidia bacterium]MBP7244562.1 DNA repair protein RecN [Bacteroidia bacterium]
MLKQLSVKNYILIDELDIRLEKGLGIITGETGAGKSILLGALGLMLGQRADVGELLDKKKKCIIEGVFDVQAYQMKTFFEEKELDYADECTIRREINPEGKSRAFVNDTPVNLTTLKELSSRLVDIHSQHESLLLGNRSFQLNVLDAYAGNQDLLKAYKSNFTTWKQSEKAYLALLDEEAKSKSDFDYLNFQYNEISALKLKDGEQVSLESEQQKLEHGEEIVEQLNRSVMLIRDGDENVVAQLSLVHQLLQGIKKFDDQFETQSDRIQSVLIELKDIHAELEDAIGKLQLDPKRLEEVNERLSFIYNLQKKHRLQSIEELLQFEEELSQKLQRISSFEDEILRLKKEVDEKKSQLLKSGNALTASRKKAIPALEKEVTQQLSELAMPHAMLRIALIEENENTFTADGMEKIQFLFSANKGGDFKELAKVASGGEMSRLMLCIKSIMARLTAMPTVIFDEIDTGISGETAARVGAILKQMAKDHQVLAITHLPQIASKGNTHFLVYKEVKKSSTRSQLRILNDVERLNEIARMLSGEVLTDAALDNARVLLSQ